MDNAKQHWEILQGLGTDLASRVREFMVTGKDGDGLLVATEDGQGFWLGEMNFGSSETRTSDQPTPLNVPELVHMAHGYNHILLHNKRGEIYSMGRNDWGQLGLGTKDKENHFSPQIIPSPHKFISVRCGKWHSLALTDDGKVWAWGSNVFGQIGVSNSTFFLPSLRQISELDSHRVVAVECGGTLSLALTDQGEVYIWGWNDKKQFVDEIEVMHNLTRIPIPSPVQSIAAGHNHSLLLTQTGEVYACGDNGSGELVIPTDIEFSPSLVRVAGLPFISQISAYIGTSLSVAMSTDKRCFVWGELRNNRAIISTPRELPPFYSTVDSPFSFYSNYRSTPHSVSIPVTLPSPLSVRMSRMFDNRETSPDVQFVVEQRTIHAHRIILSNSSDYFARMFSERWMAPVDPEDPIVRVTIPDHSYQVFHVFLRFLYTDSLEVHPDLLPELFKLASQYLVPELQQLCLSRMRTTCMSQNCSH